MTETRLIVLAAVSGKQCSHLIPRLYSDPSLKLRLTVNSQSSKERLEKEWPKAVVMTVDLADKESCEYILNNATAVLHIGPSYHPRESEIGYDMISIMHTQLRKLLNHDCKRYVEEALMESGLNYTMLQPITFLDNIPVAMPAQQGPKITFPAMWSPDVRFSMLALSDLGEVTAKVIREGGKHYYAEYALTSTWPVSQGEIVRELGRITGKEVVIEEKDIHEAGDMLYKRLFKGQEPSTVAGDIAERMVLYYNRHGLVANPGICDGQVP